MVKHQDTPKRTTKQASKKSRRDAERTPKINANTPAEVCEDRLTTFGGMLALVKMFDLLGFEREFKRTYAAPGRTPVLGHYRMVCGLLMLLFIGFQRLGHLRYLRGETMLCGFLKVPLLPVVSTFWRYLKSLGIGQSESLLRLYGRMHSGRYATPAFAESVEEYAVSDAILTAYPMRLEKSGRN